MKQQASRKIMRTLLASAIGVMLPAGAAYALEIFDNHIDDPRPGAMTPQFDASKFDRIEFLDNVVWVQKTGAEGPRREETMDESGKYEPIDVMDNVIWVPKSGAQGPMREETPAESGYSEQDPPGAEGPMRQETTDDAERYQDQSESD